MAELVDALDLGSSAFGRVGSTPSSRTKASPYRDAFFMPFFTAIIKKSTPARSFFFLLPACTHRFIGLTDGYPAKNTYFCKLKFSDFYLSLLLINRTLKTYFDEYYARIQRQPNKTIKN